MDYQELLEKRKELLQQLKIVEKQIDYILTHLDDQVFLDFLFEQFDEYPEFDTVHQCYDVWKKSNGRGITFKQFANTFRRHFRKVNYRTANGYKARYVPLSQPKDL